MTSQLDRLVSRIKRLEEAQRRANRTPQLRHSSIENGAVNVYDGSGQLTGIIGKQFDGTTGAVTVAGPTPPVPTAATAETANSGVLVTWDGTFVQTSADRIAGRPTVAPQDFKRVEVQVADNVDFTAAKPGGDFISAAGGSVYVPWTAGATVYVRLRSWSLAGKFSAWSLTSAPVTAGKIGVGDIGFDLTQLGGTRFYYGSTDPSSDPGNTLDYGDLWLKETDPGPPPHYELNRWTVVAGVDAWAPLTDQGVVDAAATAIAAQAAADTKAQLFTDAVEPAWTGDPGTAIWVDTSGDGAVIKTWDGTAFVARQLGNGAIAPGSLVASDVLATGTVTAALLEALLVLATAVVGGDPNGAHARLSALGLQTYGVDPGTGLQYEASRRGTGIGDRDAILDPNGNTVFSVDDTGAITGRTMTLAEMPTMDGRNLQDILNDGPRGIVSSSFEANLSISGILGTYGIGEVSWESEAGRNYRVHFECPHLNSTVAGQRALIALRPTIDGSSPSGATPPVTSAFFNIPAGSSNDYTPPPLTAHGTWADTNGALVRVLATVQAFSGGGTVGVDTAFGTDWFRPFRLWVEDIGPDVPDTYIPNDGSGQLSGGPPPPPPPAPKTTRTVQWDATFSKSYKGDGTPRTDTTDLYQGNGDSFNGRNASMCGFNAADIIATLSGAQINDFWVYLYAEHWWNFSGGTAQIGLHGWDFAVSNANGGTAMYWGVVGQYHFGRGEGAWFQLPPALWAGWADGTYRGLLFNAPDDNVLYYGRFSGATDSTHPIVRITFTK